VPELLACPFFWEGWIVNPLRHVLSVSFALAVAPAFAGPAEDASAVVDHWAATYSANDRDALVKLYAPDALLFGTTDKVATRGTENIRNYFLPLEKGGRRNAIQEKNVMVLGENAVVVAGFYDFSRAEQNYEPRPSRFTMLIVRQDGKWVIAHHHSSPRAAERQ
jgi:uncharacterized protein (TIGR02246 family)